MIYYPLVFLSGAAVLVIELLGTRVIAPYFGATVYVWSALITVTLAALAAGYAAGGVLADRPRPLLALGLVLGGASCWLFLLPVLQRPALAAVSGFGVRAGALAAAGLLFGPPLAALGCVGPLCIRLRTKALRRLGREVGAISAVSTGGSVLGALATGFYLIPRVPTSAVLTGLAVLLALPAAWCIWRERAGGLGAVLLLAAAGAGRLCAPETVADGKLRARALSFYGDILVVDRASWGRRYLYVNGIANTVVDLDTLDSTSDYISALELTAFLRPEARRALLVGLGGGALVHRFRAHYGIVTDVVEVDPAMERVARRWFGFRPSGRTKIGDGRRWLMHGAESYDFIVLDAFNGDQHPYHLFSLEAFAAAAERLTADGVLAVNIIGYAHGPQGELRRAVERTLRRVFPHVRVLAANRDLDYQTEYVNLIFTASRQPLVFRRDPALARPALARYYAAVRDSYLPAAEAAGPPLTDELNPIESLSAPAFLAIRRRLLDGARDVLAYGI
ncbi:MAG: fused MFS/spermidine synthase [Elusimicrobiota bacterium]